jgi:hypothetical protein
MPTARVRFLAALLAAYFLVLVGLDVLSMRTGRSGGQLINGDAKGYYAWIRSIALDHDVDFRNDYAVIYPPEQVPPESQLVTPRGFAPDKYPIGLGLVEAPGFLVGHVAAKALGYAANGVSAPYQLAVTVWLQVLCVASFAALWIALVRLGAREDVAALVIASALLATNLLQYIAKPAWSHGPGVALLNFAFLLMVTARGARNENRQIPRSARDDTRILGAGALLGLALIVRPSNVAVAPFFVLVLVEFFERWRGHIGRLIAGAAPMVAIHFASIWALWGSLRVSGYTDEAFTSGWRGIVGTLFSPRHGLFVYHPWYLMMLGIAVVAVRSAATRRFAIGALLSFVAFAGINGLWWCWWFGDSFGNRAFIEIIPALVITAALYLSSLPVASSVRRVRVFVVTAAAFAAINLMLWTGYVLRRFPPDGNHSVADAYLWMTRQSGR